MIKKYPYITATLVATLLAIVVWLCVPKEYTAVTKVSDEYKEMDLAIGLDNMMAQIKKTLDYGNTGINDMGVYCKLLTTEDFARSISHKQVPDKGMTYGEYLAKEDTVEAVLDHINYNFSNKQQTLTISFTDRESIVAAQMLDSVTAQLQQIVTSNRQRMADVALQDAAKELQKAKKKYQDAENSYTSYSESHEKSSTKMSVQHEKALEQEMTSAYRYYQKVSQRYVREKALKQRSYSSFAVITAITVPQNPSNHIIGYLLSFIILALVFTKFSYLYKERKEHGISLDYGDLFSPWAITIFVWGAILFLLGFSGNMLEPLSTAFYTDIILWVSILVATSFVVYNLMPASKRTEDEYVDVNGQVFNFLYVVAMILTPLYIYQIYKLVMMFDTKDLMMNIRELAIHGDGYGFLNYTYVVNEVLLLIGLWRYPKIPWWQLATVILACLLYAVANMEKITFFLVFASSIFVLYERGKINMRAILVGSTIVIVLFYFFNLSRSGEDSDYSQNESLLDFIGMYVLSAPVAYGRLSHTISDQFGSDTLWGIYLYFGKYFLGTTEVHQPFQDFVFVPIGTNVYTIMRPYYTDFGHVGVAFFAFLNGMLMGVAYRMMKNRNSFGTCLYTFLVYVLVLQFYDEFLTSCLPMVGQMLILLILVTQQKFKFSFNRR